MYRRKNYWPLLHVAASLAGLISLGGLVLFVMVLTKGLQHADNPVLAVLFFASIIGIPGAACIGVFRKAWWGRGVMTFIAAIYMLGFPVGTILGFFVLRGLTLHKDEFRRKW